MDDENLDEALDEIYSGIDDISIDELADGISISINDEVVFRIGLRE